MEEDDACKVLNLSVQSLVKAHEMTVAVGNNGANNYDPTLFLSLPESVNTVLLWGFPTSSSLQNAKWNREAHARSPPFLVLFITE